MTHQPGIHHLAIATSTQDVVRTLSHAPHLTTVLADVQTAGRGRLGRTWESPSGHSLLASTLIVLPSSQAYRAAAGYLTLIGALAMRAALHSRTSARFNVKYPNDVVNVAGKKIGGVLGEFFPEMSATRGELCAAIGVGVNVWQEEADLVPGATSVATEGLIWSEKPGGVSIVVDLLECYLHELNTRLVAFTATETPASAPIIAEVNDHLAGRGEFASVAGVSGVIEGLTSAAELVLNTGQARVRVTTDEVAMFVERGLAPAARKEKR